MKKNNTGELPEHPFANLFEQAANITKAHGYDILAKQVKELKEQKEKLAECVRELIAELNCYDLQKETPPVIEKAKAILNRINKQ